jgi:hypothetical protein
MLKCTICKKELSDENFGPSKQNSRGRRYDCKKCVKEYTKNRHTKLAAKGLCQGCGQNKARPSMRYCEKCAAKTTAFYYTPSGRYPEYRNQAKRRNIPFELSKEYFINLATSPCKYCKATPNPVMGVDRIDSTQGYTEMNTVPCCTSCNYAKHTKTEDEFKEWIIKVYTTWIKA